MSVDEMKESNFTPISRWEGEIADPSVLAEGFRFPYACNVVTQNRFMKSAMSELLATFDKKEMSKSGIPTKELINLYKKFGDGGYGIIVTGCIMVNGRDLEAPGNVIIDRDFDTEERREAFKEWTAAGKSKGSLMIAQLFHPGKYATDLPNKSNFDINMLTREDIRKLIEEYAYAAKFAQDCGFDGAEISSAYFYTLGQFLTDGANSRTDEYGGSLENRSRLLFGIMQKLRMRLPRQNNFVFGVKLYSGNFEQGYIEDDFSDFVHNVEKTGFDYVTITGGHYNLLREISKDGSVKGEHFYQTIVPAIKRNLTRTKLFMSGNFVTLSDMCDAVKKRWAAGIALAKPVAAEPDLPKKMLASEVRGAVKSLIEPEDFFVEVQVAGTQLWQHGMNLDVMDPSNQSHVEQFQKCFSEYNELQLRADETRTDRIVGYPKLILEESQQQSTDSKQMYSVEFGSVLSDPQAQIGEKFEEEVHEVTETDFKKAVSPIGMHTQTVADSFQSFERRFEDDGNMEIVEESFEKVVTSNVDFVEPAKKLDEQATLDNGEKNKTETDVKLMNVESEEEASIKKKEPKELSEEIPNKGNEDAMGNTLKKSEKKAVDVPEATLEGSEDKTSDNEEFLRANKEDKFKMEKRNIENSVADVTAVQGINAVDVKESETKEQDTGRKLPKDSPEFGSEVGEDVRKISEILKEAISEEQKITNDLAASPKVVDEDFMGVPLLTEETVKKHEVGDAAEDANVSEAEKKIDGKSENLKELASEMQEIIAGITSNSKEVITGLQENNKLPKEILEETKEVEEIKLKADNPILEEKITGEGNSGYKDVVQDLKRPEDSKEEETLKFEVQTPMKHEILEEKEKVEIEDMTSQKINAPQKKEKEAEAVTPKILEKNEGKKEEWGKEVPEWTSLLKKLEDEDDRKVTLAEATDTSTNAKVEITNEQTPNDVEEKIEKVVLQNISLAGLISNLDTPAPVPKGNQEIVSGITSDNQEIIVGLAEKTKDILEETPSVLGEIQEKETVAKQSVQSNSAKEGKKEDFNIPKQVEEVVNEYNDVKQWLVFTKEKCSSPSKEFAYKPQLEEEDVTLVKSENAALPSDEFKNVKQWLVFTKNEERILESKAPIMPEKQETTIEEQFKHVKQWLVFNQDDAPLPSSGGVSPTKIKGFPEPLTDKYPLLEKQARDDNLGVESQTLQYDELEPTNESLITHKQMFGSSVQDKKNIDEIPTETQIETTSIQKRVENFEEFSDTPKKPDEKKSGGFSGFFKSAFTNPVQKLFSDTKDKVEEQITVGTDEFFDTTEPLQSEQHTETFTYGDGNDSSLQEIISERHIVNEPEVTVTEEVKETLKTIGQPGIGQESSTTIATTTTKRTQKKRSSKYSRKDKKGSSEDHGFEFI